MIKKIIQTLFNKKPEEKQEPNLRQILANAITMQAININGRLKVS